MVKHTFKMLQLFASRFFKVCLTIYTFHVKNMEFRRVFGTLWKRRNVFARIVLAGNYMFQVNNRNIRTRCEICSKLTIKTPERPQWHISPCSCTFIANFEYVNNGYPTVRKVTEYGVIAPIRAKYRKIRTRQNTYIWIFFTYLHYLPFKTTKRLLKKLQSNILYIICTLSLLCSIGIYKSLHFPPTLLNN